MEVVLRQRLEGVARLGISESEQTTAVTFAPPSRRFSPEVFRTALRQVGIEVLTMDVNACGAIERQANTRWLQAGETRFLLTGEFDPPSTPAVCVTGRLQTDPSDDTHRLVVDRVEPGPETLDAP
ncbi:MAG TPA: hypothetical protein VM364_20950 [Vicinamibacterales bacterium]|nr:hypothetical protein [Vicinamibacterales bacterium]